MNKRIKLRRAKTGLGVPDRRRLFHISLWLRELHLTPPKLAERIRTLEKTLSSTNNSLRTAFTDGTPREKTRQLRARAAQEAKQLNALLGVAELNARNKATLKPKRDVKTWRLAGIARTLGFYQTTRNPRLGAKLREGAAELLKAEDAGDTARRDEIAQTLRRLMGWP